MWRGLIARTVRPSQNRVEWGRVRVLTVGNLYPPHDLGGGYERVWHAAVEHLRAAGHEVLVLATDHRDPTVAAEEPHVRRDLRWYWRDHVFPRLSVGECEAIERHNAALLDRVLDEFAPDVVSWWSMGGMSLSLLDQVRRRDLPAVAFLHDGWLDYGPRVDGWLARGRGSVRFGAAARYVFVSATTRDRARAGGHALPDTGIAHSGIDTAYLGGEPADDWRWRLLCVGRIDPRKGVETAVDALAHLPAEATLTIAGTGDADTVRALTARAEAAGVADRIVLAGRVHGDDLVAAYDECDVVLFPVRWEEPWGLVPLEGMASARPVLATGRGGSREYLRDGENALLFEGGDAAGLAAAVRRLADEPGLRARLVEEGLRLAPRHTEAVFNEAVEREVSGAVERPRPATVARQSADRLAVVIPTQGRDTLQRTLDHLERQDLPRDRFDVVVVDSTQHGSPGAAREAGWRGAGAPVVLFLDDDILLPPGALAEHLRLHASSATAGAWGDIRFARELDVTPFMRWLEAGQRFHYGITGGVRGGWGRLCIANVSVRRSLLEAAGGFDADRFPFDFGALELLYRLACLGLEVPRAGAATGEPLHVQTLEEWQAKMPPLPRAERRFTGLHPGFPPLLRDRMAE